MTSMSLRLLVAILLIGSIARAAGPEQKTDLAPRVITGEMSCPVCGMYPDRFPQWQTQIIFTDHTGSAFDGGKCMFSFLLNPGQYAPGRNNSQVTAVWVRDFGSGKWIDGKAARYVVGSRVMGPMGKELLPFAEQAAAEAFQKANGGIIKTYAEINLATIKSLANGGMHMGGH
ncbi:MAG: hypothetical protein A2505_06885 [Deltaproteobacteria bacterium RIFOXYD12_FULL_55_16]|nr:MAG: hypothetical protein A2505_06885 [Deltaproteobacteria bacterium RIFOXYD12_FULL_55_16]